jgi:hypothetical protein
MTQQEILKELEQRAETLAEMISHYNQKANEATNDFGEDYYKNIVRLAKGEAIGITAAINLIKCMD